MGLLHAGDGSERPSGPGGPAGGGERSGDIQREQLLHVPRPEAAAVRNGSELNGVRAGPRPQRKRN